MRAVLAPGWFSTNKLYIIERTYFDTFSTGDAFLRGIKLFRFDEQRVKYRVDGTALYLP